MLQAEQSKLKSNNQKTINLNTLPAQRRLLLSKSRIVAFVGGLGSGKTRGAVYKAIQLGFLNAPCVGLFVQPSYTLIKDTGIESFKTVLRELDLKFKIHLTNFEIEVEGAFKILLRSGDEPERIVGTNAGWGIIDEPGLQDEKVGQNVLARIRDPRSKLPQLVLTGTPEGFNWFYDWTFRDDIEVVRAKTAENPYLPSDYVDQLKKSYTDEELQAYINGEFIRFEGGWYKVRPKIINPIERINGINIYRKPDQTSNQVVIGVDTGGGLLRDSSAIAVVDKRDKTLVATWVSNKATVDELAQNVEVLFNYYTKFYESDMPGFVKSRPTDIPSVIIESNGIGETTWQLVNIKGKIPAFKQKTSEASRYQGMMLTKRAVESGIIEGPTELAEEADKLVVDNGKFEGPKDLSMAIGFCLLHIEKNPYRPPEPNRRKVFTMNL